MIGSLLTVTEAAEILKVTPARVRQLIMEGRIKATKVHDRLSLIERADLDAYRQSPTPKLGRPRKDRPA